VSAGNITFNSTYYIAFENFEGLSKMPTMFGLGVLVLVYSFVCLCVRYVYINTHKYLTTNVHTFYECMNP
jgi:hypothetical protein